MSNLKKCSRCNSTLDKSHFGINRKKERYKTCNNCRGVTVTQNETNTISDIAVIEQEIMKSYQDKLGIDPESRQHKVFTEEEQIERYAKNIAFWQVLENEYDEDQMFKNITDLRWQYIKRMGGTVRMTTYEKFHNRTHVIEAIYKRTNQLLNETK